MHKTLPYAKVSHNGTSSLFLKMNYKNTLMLYYFLNIIFSSAIYVIGADG